MTLDEPAFGPEGQLACDGYCSGIEECDPTCDCPRCEAQRADDDDLDRWIDEARHPW